MPSLIAKWWPALVGLAGLALAVYAAGNGALAYAGGYGADDSEWWTKVILPGVLSAFGLLKTWTSWGSVGQTNGDRALYHLAEAAWLMAKDGDTSGLDAVSAMIKARKKPATVS